MKKRIISHLRNRSYSNESIDYLASVRSEIQALKELKFTLKERVQKSARSKGLQHEEAVQQLESSSDRKEDDFEPFDHYNQSLRFQSESSNPQKRDDPIIRRITFEDEDEGWSAMKTRYAR